MYSENNVKKNSIQLNETNQNCITCKYNACNCIGATANYYVFHGRVTLFFANNSLTQCRITMKFLHNFL